MNELINGLKRAGWAVWAVIAALLCISLILAVFILNRGRGNGASRAMYRHIKRSLERAKHSREQAELELRKLQARWAMEDEDRAQRADAARQAAADRERMRRGPGPRRWPPAIILLMCGVCAPSPAHAQLIEAAPAEVPVASEHGPCSPGEGMWRQDGRMYCAQCLQAHEFALMGGAGDLPAGCLAPLPGVWVELSAYQAWISDTAGERSQDMDAERDLRVSRRRERACLQKLEATAAAAADALEPCAEMARGSPGYSGWTVLLWAVAASAVTYTAAELW